MTKLAIDGGKPVREKMLPFDTPLLGEEEKQLTLKQAQTESQYPVIVLRPSRGWVSLNLRDLWEYRELLYFLIWRDVKVRYKQTALDVAWVVLQPLATTFVFWRWLSRRDGYTKVTIIL